MRNIQCEPVTSGLRRDLNSSRRTVRLDTSLIQPHGCVRPVLCPVSKKISLICERRAACIRYARIRGRSKLPPRSRGL